MKIILYFTLILMYSCDPSQEKNLVDTKTRKIPKVYVSIKSKDLSFKSDTAFLNNKPYAGFIYELDATTNDLIASGGYLNGLLSGVKKKWYKGYALMEERYYLNGAKNGKQIAYWENGNKKFEFVAKNDTYEGELKEWNISGNLIHLATFVNGQEEGTQKMWYDNGKIRANYVMRKGKRYGLLGTKNCVNVSDSIFVVK
ncbi:toxin-antitoxin system YwqK family antitoxin [Lacihabitans sp. CCS-44]|uniref:toxin-antitoxin system YwqK family antitoxin n=1 Tax=Lacihabitans sp. CCS-44 TaxID=2487331 RepID=UPI0020CD14BD|nr:toxin-antitoxin system YwqK family antitoxin [Lacihabitans sp. CCS-44]